MRRKEGNPFRSFFATLAILALLLAAGVLAFVYSGRYDIAATGSEAGVVRWALETARTRAVRHHAGDVQVPSLEEADHVKGFRHFDAMCALCHGAPGVERSEIGKGLNPEPPELPREIKAWTPGELFWIVAHGVKMTGMPAFGPTHDEATLWAIVAFIRTLPEMTPRQYRELRRLYGREVPGHPHGEESRPADSGRAPRSGAPPDAGPAGPSPPAKREGSGGSRFQRAWTAEWEVSRMWDRLGA